VAEPFLQVLQICPSSFLALNAI